MSSPLTGVSPLLCVCYSNGLFAEVAGARRGDLVQTIWYAYAFLCCVVRIFEWHSHSVKNIPMANNVYSHQKGDEKQRRQRHKSKWPCLCARRQLEERESALWSPLRRQLIRLGKIKSPSLVLLTIKRFIIMRHRARPPVLLSADWFSLPAALSTSLLQSACIYSAHKDNVFAKKKWKPLVSSSMAQGLISWWWSRWTYPIGVIAAAASAALGDHLLAQFL